MEWYVCHFSDWLALTQCIAGNATYAAITAIVAANGVLVAYIIMSVMEDSQSQTPTKEKPQEESKKTR